MPKSQDLSVLTLDDRNANKGTKRGKRLLSTSLKDLGAGRSVLVDKNNVVIAGNQTIEQAGLSGYKKVRIIDTDGTEIIAVRRTDLDLKTDDVAKRLAVADNRVQEVSLEWDKSILQSLSAEIDLTPFFDPMTFAVKDPLGEVKTSGKCSVVIECEDADEQERIYHKMKAEGIKCRRETKK